MPLADESINRYRRRLAGLMQKRLPEGDELRGIDLDRIPRDAYNNFERQIYASAAAAERPDRAASDELREITRIDPRSDFKEHVFIGKESFVRDPAYGHRPGRRVLSFNRTAIEPIRY